MWVNFKSALNQSVVWVSEDKPWVLNALGYAWDGSGVCASREWLENLKRCLEKSGMCKDSDRGGEQGVWGENNRNETNVMRHTCLQPGDVQDRVCKAIAADGIQVQASV